MKSENLYQALKELDEAFSRGEALSIGLISHLKRHQVKIVNHTGNFLRKNDLVCTADDGIFWNGPRVTRKYIETLHNEIRAAWQEQKREGPRETLHIHKEMEVLSREIELLYEQIDQKRVILEYLKSKTK